MGVTLDAVSGMASLNGNVTGVNVTSSITIGATANFAIILVDASLTGGLSDASIAFSTLTLGGQALTHLTGAKKHSGTDSQTCGFTDIYYLPSPPTGVQTLSVTMTYTGGGSNGFAAVWAESYIGVNLTTPLGSAQVINGQSVASLTIGDTLTAADFFTGIACNGSTAPSVTTGTSDGSATLTPSSCAGNVRIAHNSGSGTVNLVFGTNNTDWSAASGVKLLTATAAPAILPIVEHQQAVNRASFY